MIPNFRLTLTAAAIAGASTTYAAKVLPVLNDAFETYRLYASNPSSSLDLNTVFGTQEIDDQAVRFTSTFSNSEGRLVIDFALFNSTPATKANFLNYVNSGAYENQIIHRRPSSDFVVQGGGYFYNPDSEALEYIPTNSPVVNEFGISNTLWTVAMAKLGGDPDSATSQWFININANSANLDNQNGGFTVFARVLQSTQNDAGALISTSNFPVYDMSGLFGSAFSSMPLYADYDGTNLSPQFLNMFSTATLVDVDSADAGESTDLTFSLDSNSNSSLISASINASEELELSATPGQFGSSTLRVTATDSVGNEVSYTFSVEVTTDFTTWREDNFSPVDAVDDNVSGPTSDPDGTGFTNLENYAVSNIVQGNRGPQLIDAVTFEEASNTPTITFPFRNDIFDVSYAFQYSPDLGTTPWSTIPFSETARTTNGTLDRITIEIDTSSLPPNQPAFFRRVLNYTTTPAPIDD